MRRKKREREKKKNKNIPINIIDMFLSMKFNLFYDFNAHVTFNEFIVGGGGGGGDGAFTEIRY